MIISDKHLAFLFLSFDQSHATDQMMDDMIQGCEVSVTGITIVKVNILTHIHSQVLLVPSTVFKQQIHIDASNFFCHWQSNCHQVICKNM